MTTLHQSSHDRTRRGGGKGDRGMKKVFAYLASEHYTIFDLAAHPEFDAYCAEFAPSHWMPLPKPPSTTQSQTGRQSDV